MANFAKEQLMKYGWMEGKGLGKNENGITEPVKLATSQNKAGIGYDEYETPWWEKMYNNASKNVKVESHGDQVSLTVVNDTNAAQTRRNELSNSFKKAANFQIASVLVDNVLDSSLKVGAISATNQKSHMTRDGASELVLTSNEKSKKITIVEHNSRVHSNPQLNVAGKNAIAYRIPNVESDIEESSEHDVDENASIPQVASQEEQFSVSKSMKKKHYKKVRSLMNQLSTCNLEENNAKHVVLNKNKIYKKLAQKQRNYEFKKKLEQMAKTLKFINRESDLKYIKYREAYKVEENMEKLIELNNLPDEESELGKYGSEKDSIGHKIKSELKPIKFNDSTTKPDWIEIDFHSRPVHDRQQSIQKKMARNYTKYRYDPSTKAIINRQTEMSYPKIHTKIHKKDSHAIGLGHKKRIMRKCYIKFPKISENYLKVKHMDDFFRHELDMDSVIKDLAECGLVEKVNIIKKRSTQTHLTPV